MADMFKLYFVRGPKPEETNETIKRYIVMLDDDVVKGSFHFASSFVSNDNPLQQQNPRY